MSRRANRRIPKRRRIFLGCEGESEQAYAALLRRLLDDRGRFVHIDAVLLQPGGGDPLALVEIAVRQMRTRQRRAGASYAIRAVLLDNDTWGRTPERDERAVVTARGNAIQLIWQRPCHEALLLRHLEGCSNLRPPTAQLAHAQLQRRWPEYRKPMPGLRLASRIDGAAVERAARVEPELNNFLMDIGFSN